MTQNYNELLASYWRRRLKPARIYTMLISFGMAHYYSRGLHRDGAIVRDGPSLVAMVCVVQSILTILMAIPSFFQEDFEFLIRYALMLGSLMPFQGIFLIHTVLGGQSLVQDEHTHHAKTDEISTKLFASILYFTFHVHNFDHGSRGHTSFGLFLICYILSALWIESSDLRSHSFDPDLRILFTLFVTALPPTLILLRNETAHMEHVQKMLKNISDQEFLKLVLNMNPASLAIFDKDCRITFSNDFFSSLFKEHIERALETFDRSSSTTTHRQAPSGAAIRPDLIKRFQIKQWCKKNSKKPKQKYEECELSQIQTFGTTPEEHQNFEAHFYDLPMLSTIDEGTNGHSQAVDDEGTIYSLRDILQNPELASQRTFKIAEIEPEESANATNPFQALYGAARELRARFVRIEIKSLVYLEQQRQLVQIIDISDSVLYGKSKEQNEMLSILNATVSHEMRNPLNAISGQNVQKEGLYASLQRLIDEVEAKTSPTISQTTRAMREIMDRLNASLKVQDSSSRLMSFLVQDFLDYAQIKSGKFRVNPKPFNLREAVEKVLSIQRLKAKEQQIALEAEFENINNNAEESCGEYRFSPMVISDEQRLMQVLLNLQSNALKFTRRGKVIIRAKVAQVQRDRYVEISVSDTGVGIPYQDQDKLFKLFGFVSSTEQYNRNGIGLGLVISEKIVKKFGGRISFHSTPAPRPNHGTTFTFSFKLESEANFQQAQSDVNLASTAFQLNSKTLVFQWKPSPRQEDAECPSEQSSIQSEESLWSVPQLSQSHASMRDLRQWLPTNSKDSTSNFTENIDTSLELNHTTPPKSRLSQFAPIRKRGMQADWKSAVALQANETQEVAAKKKILIVDDQIFNIQAMKAILEHRFNIKQHQMDHALNGEEALTKIHVDSANFRDLPPKKKGFHQEAVPCTYPLILMDCNMPFMDGFECTKFIREHFADRFNAPLEQQPIISATTGHVEKQYIDKCFRIGMNQVLSKPVEEDALLAACIQAGFATKAGVEEFQEAQKLARR